MHLETPPTRHTQLFRPEAELRMAAVKNTKPATLNLFQPDGSELVALGPWVFTTPRRLGFGVQGIFRVQGLGFRAQGLADFIKVSVDQKMVGGHEFGACSCNQNSQGLGLTGVGFRVTRAGLEG